MGFNVSAQRIGHAQPMAEINMIPLIDVMLVLVVIFLVTAPLLNRAEDIDLPREHAGSELEADAVHVVIDAQQRLRLNGRDLAWEELEDALRLAAGAQASPELQLQADRLTPYESIARLIAAARSAGLRQVAFVMDPRPLR
ncbi:ExbD/TolR family protein [Pseudothauera lacus]|uniref:Biopolymer transporter ExbD n=1 Tax=Pseudothauera lacus TaxID=2136175 RepID=A0A2T4IK65_9RHOO|nr:biopolymer transporter ExbD [Pseudothauera lacus]PTD98155.1 biopolymer transporter ExbD [Pseudothauera lacus]